VKASQLRELTADELAKKVEDLKSELFNLRFRLATGELDNPMRVRLVRRDIARALTVQRARELAGEDMTARTKLVSAREAAARGGARRAGRAARAGGAAAPKAAPKAAKAPKAAPKAAKAPKAAAKAAKAPKAAPEAAPKAAGGAARGRPARRAPRREGGSEDA
jgi:large subunit ribosomal protein L29